jgi:hypothetical protein
VLRAADLRVTGFASQQDLIVIPPAAALVAGIFNPQASSKPVLTLSL